MSRRAALLLVLAATVHAASAAVGCRSYTSKGLIQPAIGSLQDSVVVQDAFDVKEMSVTLDVGHRRIGALKITLGASPFSNAAGAGAVHPTIILKSQGLGRKGHNLYRTTFSDTAALAFPLDPSGAPFTGSFRPVQKLEFLADGQGTVAGSGGSQGMWTLAVADVAPNNTLREIALNGWTLVLCDDVQQQQQAVPSPPPAPLVQQYSGPPAASNPSTPSSLAGPSSILGWQVVYKGAPPSPSQPGAAPQPAPVWPPAGGSPLDGMAQPLKDLLAQKPLLTMLQGQIHAIAAGIGGTCDATCTQAKQNMWRAAVFGLYMRSVAEKHGVDRLDWATWVQHVRDWLPGENSKLGELQSWLEAHADDASRLGTWLHDHLRLPTIMVDGQPLQLPAIGNGAALQHLLSAFSSGGDKVQALLSAFAAAGDRIAQLAVGLAGRVGDHAGSVGDKLGAGAERVRDALAAGRERRQEMLGSVAGRLDARGEGFHTLMNGLEGSDLGQLSALGKGSMQDLAASLAAMFDVSGSGGNIS
ncbi:hypothetical protein D9Q98_004334 [Chlorella vulgaris]|uniref:Uncharacterized protein n=1 Tax=Chlorella vulgaris TaxID=3077 RepID=A0A9D4TPQ0_CHLVU|nr:hypothetical protein D9Q98_004334 [Chlorella vulgaris]